MKRLGCLSVFLFLNFFVFLLPVPVFASEEFTTSYRVLYEATKEGKVLVTQEVSLTNKSSQFYASEYSFSLERVNPQNISAYDNQGPLTVAVKTQEQTTKMTVHLDRSVVGKDQTQKFTLKYEASELLRHFGQVWELVLPKIGFLETLADYHLTLKVPSLFGQPAYLSPLPKDKKSEGTSLYFFYEKEQLGSQGLVAAFGQFQVFDFTLIYHLANPSGENVWTKIAFPPDTSYQKVAYWQILPSPENLEVDQDGNWLGRYNLKPKEKIIVKAQGQAKIFSFPQTDYSLLTRQSLDLEKYLSPQKYWEVDNPQIKTIAKNLKTAREIHNFVVKTLDYDYSRVREGVKRLGAVGILSQPDRAICMEYTDLFITLARAAGIPARELNGYAYTENSRLYPLSLVQDVLHSWPEYYDLERKNWVQVDPTWQDTTGGVDYFDKFDLGHFAFVIHGQDSEKPLPAGAYKDSGLNQKDVQISFGKYQEPKTAELTVDFLFPQTFASERQKEGQIRLTNTGQEALYNLSLEIKSENLKLLSESQKIISVLPPKGYLEIPLKLASWQSFSKGSGKIIVLGNRQRWEKEISYQSLVLSRILPLSLLLLFPLLLFFLRQRIISFFLKRRKDDQGSSRELPPNSQ